MTKHIRHALDIDINHPIKFRGGHRPQRRRSIQERRVIDQNIRSAVTRTDLFGPKRDTIFLRHIEGRKIVRRRVAKTKVKNFGTTTTTDDGVSLRDIKFSQSPTEPTRDTGNQDVHGEMRKSKRDARNYLPPPQNLSATAGGFYSNPAYGKYPWLG